MKKVLYYLILCLSVAMVSCVDEDFVAKGKLGEGETMAHLKFGHQSFEEIEIKTRATLTPVSESRIENIFVFIFDSAGHRVYSHYFDNSSKVDVLPDEVANYWTINNRTSNNDNDTHGEVLMKVPIVSDASIYVLANLNADMMNISSDELYFIETLDELKTLDVTLSQEITSRGGGFLMTGSVNGVNIAENGDVTKGGAKVKVDLIRLDAKVKVNVKLGKNVTYNLKRFMPESWRVMRLPKGCKVIDGDESADELGFFDSEVHFFDKDNSNEKSFSFYLLENKKSSTGLTSYHQREERYKNADGTYDLSKGMWKHVDDNATYMIIKGRLQMEVKTHEDWEMQYLEADVTYFIHLGNFGSSINGGNYNDFNVLRNTSYEYTITVNGVDNIKVEVLDDKENQSGAIGDIYESLNDIYTYDAHYGQRVYLIDSEAVIANTLTWYVKTPYGEGMPGLEFGEDPNLDYKWAWYKVNPIDESTNQYSLRNQWYPGDQYQAINYAGGEKVDSLWTVKEMVEWLRAEKIKLENAPESEKNTASAFRKNDKGRYVIAVTVFVDEYYYEENPITNNSPEDWRNFVNKPNRIMHILCDSKFSKDEDSSLTSSIITLRQRSIQTPYNVSGTVSKAWGCETEDEFINSHLFFYGSNETLTTGKGSSQQSDFNTFNMGEIGTCSETNGLYNSLIMWGIDTSFSTKSLWADYFDYNRVNDYKSNINTKSGTYNLSTYFLKDEKAALRYSSLMRNRDNNGNGVIDQEEIRWYVATLNQLYELYIGELGIEKDAYLYLDDMVYRNEDTFGSGPYISGETEYWRNHIISSTWEQDADPMADGDQHIQPVLLWAEEGLSISQYFNPNYWNMPSPKSTKSVRNLGVSTPSFSSTDKLYDDLIVYSYDLERNVYRFDLTHVNSKSVRYFTTHELELGDEYFETSRPYYVFETGQVFQREYLGSSDNNVDNYGALREDLENANPTGCPTGYRVPNVREGAIMALYCSSDWWNKLKADNWGRRYAMVATTYSKGAIAGKDPMRSSWQFGYRAATQGMGATINIVPVRDVK